MKALNRKEAGLEENLPIRVLQFGEGNFLRAFVDYAIQELNEHAGFNGGVAVVQPIDRGLVNMLNDQDGLYTLFMKGVSKGKVIEDKKLVSSIVKGIDPYTSYESYLELARLDTLDFVFSNTTEAGISFDEKDTPEMTPPNSYPAKLTRFLLERYRHFEGAADKGLTIIPCELINYNSDTLKDIILQYSDLWRLEEGFRKWIIQSNSFHNTLVDRIVPGYPKDEIEAYNSQLDYKDNLIVTAEAFFLWVIEGDEELMKKLPFDRTDLNVLFVNNMQPYRTRKVRILNGAHTALVPMSILYGNVTVKESVDNAFTGKYLHDTVFEEIIPTLDLERKELVTFAEEVFDRFRNPFIKHLLASIALNSISKFKVRVLPSLLNYIDKCNRLPLNLCFSFAALIRFYKGEWQGETLPVNDNAEIVAFFNEVWKENDYLIITEKVLKNASFWDEDLSMRPDLTEAVAKALELIDTKGIEGGYQSFVK
ncbi:tagaturonate reductase [Robertkochia solimangrovi]|uniref:tagaturonate reductase n=1 Tax=Robertkochia solimangrovi TaxID=2213046 RepID=UPI001180016A|nr:tagaturonate reductase [Robertkochia solimangrovi]TRZ46205.1 tagaturonate reductase [Robertkochia solimangrovi]